MEDQATGQWGGIRKALVGGPTWFVGFVSGLVSSIAPGREARKAQSRERFVADWRQRVKRSLGEESDTVLGNEGSDVTVADGKTLTQLRQSLMGVPKVLVSTLLGKPASTFHSESHAAAPSSAYWEADVWYYPADLRRRVALAIHFENDVVTSVERLIGPSET